MPWARLRPRVTQLWYSWKWSEKLGRESGDTNCGDGEIEEDNVGEFEATCNEDVVFGNCDNMRHSQNLETSSTDAHWMNLPLDASNLIIASLKLV